MILYYNMVEAAGVEPNIGADIITNI